MDANDGDVGAVSSTAHVQAASHGDVQLGGQLVVGHEVLVQVVHDSLDDAGSVGSRRVAVNPTLGVDDVGQGVTSTANRVTELLDILDQRIDVSLVGDQELDVVARSEAQVAIAVLVSEVADLADVVDSHQARLTCTNSVQVARRTDVLDDARLNELVVFPLAVVLFDDRRDHLFIIHWALVSDSQLNSPLLIVAISLLKACRVDSYDYSAASSSGRASTSSGCQNT